MHGVSSLLLCLTQVILVNPPQQNEQKAKEVVVPKIKAVDVKVLQTDPPSLSVSVVGEVTTGGYENTRLVRVTHPRPPLDGIQDYRLVAKPPTGPAIQVLTKLSAEDVWRDYQNEAPWLKGIRVHGSGNGTVVRMFKNPR